MDDFLIGLGLLGLLLFVVSLAEGMDDNDNGNF